MSSNVNLRFTKAGLQTLIQDGGRVGHQASGVPRGGAMDRTSVRIANWLVGNEAFNPVIEMAMMGPEVIIDGSCQIAITGADMTPTVDGKEIPMYQTLNIKGGSKLSFGPLKKGCRSYVAIGGRWLMRQWLNSYSSASHASKELTPDSVISKGTEIEIEPVRSIAIRSLSAPLRPDYPGKIALGFLPGPEYSTIPKHSRQHFFSSGHVITGDSNRMGYRLKTELDGYTLNKEVISSGVYPGTIQITSSGQPIILMADAQTTGGYPRIGNVISAHLDKLAQAKPGDELWFKEVTLRDAQLALRDREETLRLVLTSRIFKPQP